MHFLDKKGNELGHFLDRHLHSTRNSYKNISKFKEFINSGDFLSSDKYACVSTTFKDLEGNHKAFVGLDVEIDDEKAVYKTVQYLSRCLFKSIDLFKTSNSFHLFIPDLVFDNDLEYVRKLLEISNLAALFMGDGWVSKYSKSLAMVRDYKTVQRVFSEILGEVGHYKEKGIYTFFDLRHIAHGVIEYERTRGKVYKNDGIRTQLFFRVTTKGPDGNVPYFIRRFT
jgi:hypothetical protein